MSRTLNKVNRLLTKRLCLNVYVEHFQRHWLALEREYYAFICMILVSQGLFFVYFCVIST